MLEHLAILDRRHMLRATMAAGVAAGVAGCARIVPQGLGLALTPSPLTDAPVLNFALNLEYLEAEYYARGVTGTGLSSEMLGPKPGAITGGRQVTFQTPFVREFMAEIADDERHHVGFLRKAIKGKLLVEMSCPAIDFTAAFAPSVNSPGSAPISMRLPMRKASCSARSCSRMSVCRPMLARRNVLRAT
ncbi:ferritin-like domain-containing protein [Sphingomonas oligophenolica]|uniref:Ferritin-like domain-containing protein n=1 Tax=Sphingomonas oligophenolica TaxID=301154 RepID=A0A502C8X3_9SPHN|nr:ferritin-like domain-containing protein [Sphingomonas oligophenolica]TPG09637.1 ferritin-like domain-containing protein [Sphingomonas oligophenolica]